MSYDLIGPDDLAHLSGAPFTEGEVEDAVASLRAALGWHIAPVIEETVTLDVTCSDPVLRLPTRRLVSVEEIRRTDTDAVIEATGYKVSTALSRIRRGSSWPSGYGAVEVDMTHGFAECPPELRPIIGQMIDSGRSGGGDVTQESLGSWSVSYGSGGSSGGLSDRKSVV